MICSLDPSFSSTGLCCLSDDLTEVIMMRTLSTSLRVQEKRNFALASKEIVEQLDACVQEVYKEHPEPIAFMIEQPSAYAGAGGILMYLHACLINYMESTSLPVSGYCVLPCTACDSFICNKEHRKKFITDWSKERFNITKRINNDIATALVLACIWKEIRAKTYNKVYYYYPKVEFIVKK